MSLYIFLWILTRLPTFVLAIVFQHTTLWSIMFELFVFSSSNAIRNMSGQHVQFNVHTLIVVNMLFLCSADCFMWSAHLALFGAGGQLKHLCPTRKKYIKSICPFSFFSQCLPFVSYTQFNVRFEHATYVSSNKIRYQHWIRTSSNICLLVPFRHIKFNM